MRNRLIAGLLVISVASGFALFGNSFFAASKATSTVPYKQLNRANLPLSPHRDFISQGDAKSLAERKLAPWGTNSLLKVPAVMRHGDFVWNEQRIAKGHIYIWVDLRRQMISAFRNGHEIGTAVIIYGAEDYSSPEGRFPILNKHRHYHSRTYDAPMPASLFITNDGVALHGSEMSSRRASHGCIGLPVAFAEQLFDAAKVGDVVEITRSQKDPREPLRLKG